MAFTPFLQVNFLINATFEHVRMRRLLGSSVYFTSFFPNAAFKRGIMVFILLVLVYVELLLCLIVTLS